VIQGKNDFSHSEIWSDCLKYLKERVPAQTFNTWFEPIQSLSITEKELFLQVPNKFFYDWVDSHYSDILNKALETVTGFNLKIKYTILLSQDNIKATAPVIDESEKSKPVVTVKSSVKKTGVIEKGTKINKNYTFSNFVEGKSNQFAKAAAMAVANSPGRTSFNPLVLYGGTGLGKTHLLQAVGNEIINNNRVNKVVYLSSDTFTLDFIASIQKNKSTDFSTYYRNVDMLLLDDIQFFQGKESTQEQFFHIFNSLYQHHKQIVLTTDKNPMELKGLQERLLSRFKSGLNVDIQPPDLETRIAILQKKAEIDKLDIPYDVIEMLASKIKSNIRELEGAMIRLLAYSSLLRVDINLSLTKKVLNEIVGSKNYANTTVSIEHIQEIIINNYNVTLDMIVGKGRKKEVAEARMTAMYFARQFTTLSLKSIGLYFGGRDHSTVVHACKWVEKKYSESADFSRKINFLKSELDEDL